MSLIVFVSLLALPTPLGHGELIFPVVHKPALSLSSVRRIGCDEGLGTGFLVAENVLATAEHVADGTNCIDMQTGLPLKTYYRDRATDFALMTGTYPSDLPYVRINCQGYQTNREYFAYGWRDYFRMDRVKATANYTSKDYIMVGRPWPGMRELSGTPTAGVQGMSGGPISESSGDAVGMVNSGEWNVHGTMHTTMSYEFKNTILCRSSLPTPRTSPQIRQVK